MRVARLKAIIAFRYIVKHLLKRKQFYSKAQARKNLDFGEQVVKEPSVWLEQPIKRKRIVRDQPIYDFRHS